MVKAKKITISLHPIELELLDKFKKDLGVNTSDCVRRIIHFYNIEKYIKKGKE